MRVKNQQGCLYGPRQRTASSIPAPAASARQRTVRVVQAVARDSRARRETHLPRGIRRQQHETPFEHRRFRRVADVHRDEQQATAVNRNHSSITPFKIEPSLTMPPSVPVIAPEMPAAPNAAKNPCSGRLRPLWMSYGRPAWPPLLQARLSQPGPRRTPRSPAVVDWLRRDTQE